MPREVLIPQKIEKPPEDKKQKTIAHKQQTKKHIHSKKQQLESTDSTEDSEKSANVRPELDLLLSLLLSLDLFLLIVLAKNPKCFKS